MEITNEEVVETTNDVVETTNDVVETTNDVVETTINQEVIPNILQPETVPKVVQNSDFLYKSDIKWEQHIEYIEPNQYEIDMLKDTKKPSELLKEEETEVVKEKTEEEIKEQKTKDLLLIFKVVSLNRMGKHPIMNTSTLQPMELQEFLKNMNLLIEDYHKGLEVEITTEFNKVCNDKLFSNNNDVSTYPIYA